MISGLHREVDDIFALLGYYAACSGNFVPLFRDTFSVLSSKFMKSLTLIMRPIDCVETSVRNYHYRLRNDREERRFKITKYMEQVN